MLILRYLAVAVSTVILFLGLAVDLAMSAQRSSAPFTLIADRSEGQALRLTWTISPRTYLYRDKFVVGDNGGGVVAVSLPPGETKDDPNFGPTEVFHDRVVGTVSPEALRGLASIRVTYQGCADRGICFPPTTARVDLLTLRVTDDGHSPLSPSSQTWGAGAATGPAEVAVSLPAGSGLPTLVGSWSLLVITFAGFGLLLSLTPCVLPMVPILAGILSRSGRASSPDGFLLSSVYVLAMASAYGFLGVVAAFSGQNLQAALQTPYALVTMAAVFVALALSSFGLFELRLPSRWMEKLAGPTGSRSGSMAGAALLGFTSALIVGPCVTPPLAAALLYVAQTGDVGRGATALFALGIGMGLPLIVVGTFGAGLLPRAGRWLLVTRYVFGAVFLALAAMLLGRVLPPQASLSLWALLTVGAGVFLGAFDRTASGLPSPVGRAAQTLGIIAAVYGATLVVGVAGGATDPLRPLSFLARPDAAIELSTAVAKTPATFDQVLGEAQSAGRPILVNFSADWCTSCKSMERDVLGNAAIARRLGNVSVIRADVTKTSPETAALMARFQVVGPPTLFFLRPADGSEVEGARTVGETSAAEFGRLLDKAGA